MKIGTKIVLSILLSAFIIYGGAIAYLTLSYRTDSLNDAWKIADSYAARSANLVKATFEKDLAVSKTFDNIMLTYKIVPKQKQQEFFEASLVHILNDNPEYLSVWMSWQLSSINSDWTKPYGRIRTTAVKNEGKIITYSDSLELDGDDINGLYYKMKSGIFDDLLVDPYPYTYVSNEIAETHLETSVSTRIMDNGIFLGIVGMDISLDRFQKLIKEYIPFERSFAFMVANNGTIVAHKESDFQNNLITDIYTEIPKQIEILENIKLGKNFSFFHIIDDEEFYLTFAPITVGETNLPWTLAFAVPVSVIKSKANEKAEISFIAALVGLFVISIMFLLIIRSITVPLQRTTKALQNLDKGQIYLAKKQKVRSNDELGIMTRSVNNLIETLKQTTDFARKIGKGDLTTDYQLHSEEDVLGIALLEMRKNLKKAKEDEEKRRKESEKISWAQNGLAQIGEILRQENDNLNEFSYNIISFLVKYLNANQGGFFISDDDDGIYKLVLHSAYAYDRKKQLDATVRMGEGLVGRCAKEKRNIYIEDVPDGYLYISSGLGDKTPEALVLEPLIFEDEVHGVLEIASLQKFEKYQINFLESVAERIASTISNIKKNIKTTQLLREFQEQSAELAERESQMTASYNELQQAQEEAKQKEMETAGLIDAIAGTAIIVQYDRDGNIISIKDPNLEDMGFTEEDIIGKHITLFAEEAKDNPEWFIDFWGKIRDGKKQNRIFKRENYWYNETYTPVFDTNGRLYKVINIGIDITESKRKDEQIKILLDKKQ